jgi:hypothetical protein
VRIGAIGVGYIDRGLKSSDPAAASSMDDDPALNESK